MNKIVLTLGLLFGFCLNSGLYAGEIPAQCKYDEECVIDLPGLICADGSQSFYAITVRPHATKLLIYMQGGGACWDNRTCGLGFAKLTRPAAGNDFINGVGVFNSHDPLNPFGAGYNIVHIPYCSGDVFAGDKVNNYGTEAKPKIIKHKGFENIKKIFKEVKKHFPNPEKVTLLGVSAGGIGAYYHMGNLVQTYPAVPKYVISDAGTPFEPPFVNKERYEKITFNWGAKDTLPRDFQGRPVSNFGELIEYNRLKYPDVKFGFISSYRDYIMTFFSFTIGSPSAKTAVFNILQDVADNRLGPNFANGRVFYLNESNHDYTHSPLGEVSSMGKTLGSWITEMVSDAKGWDNVRPENVEDSWSKEREFPRTMEELRNWKNF